MKWLYIWVAVAALHLCFVPRASAQATISNTGADKTCNNGELYITVTIKADKGWNFSSAYVYYWAAGGKSVVVPAELTLKDAQNSIYAATVKDLTSNATYWLYVQARMIDQNNACNRVEILGDITSGIPK